MSFGEGNLHERVRELDSRNRALKRELGKIVHCGDCRHYESDGEPSEVYPDRHWCDAMTMYMNPGEFCSRGERGKGGL